jgi:hypothetical protein
MPITINGSGTISGVNATGLTTAQTVSASNITTGTLPKAQLPTGNVLQVVQGTYSTNVTTSSTSLVDTGLTATITPTSASSKILVLVYQAGLNNGGNSSTGINTQLIRNGTSIYNFGKYSVYITSAVSLNGGISGGYLDSPATTSAVTYKTQFLRQDGSGSVQVQAFGDLSTITLLEIAA